MKKVLLALIGIGVSAAMSAQNSQFSSSDDQGVVMAQFSKDQIPAKIVKTATISFDKNNPATWSKFPFTLKEFGWVYEVGSTEEAPLRYEVDMKTHSGDILYGEYSADGNLLETKETSRNIPTPLYVLNEIYSPKSEYKDWKIVGNKELVTFYQEKDHSVARQNFTVTLEKGKERKRMAFSYDVSSGKLEARVIR